MAKKKSKKKKLKEVVKKEEDIVLGLFLKKKREEAGLTQKDVQEHMGYTTPQFISNWERGLISPPDNTLVELVSLYDIKPIELVQLLVEQQDTKWKILLGLKVVTV